MSWYDFVPTILDVASNIYNDVTKSNANDEAARISEEASRAATQQQMQGYDAAKGNYASSVANDQAMQDQGQPGVAQQQIAIQQQNVLTPAQEMALDNARRQTTNALQVSGLSGSGRATVAAVKNVDDTMRGAYMDQNRGRADQAASALSQQYFSAGRDVNTQNANTAAANIQRGNAAAAGTNDIGQIQSGNVTNNAALNADTAQRVGGAIATPVAGQAINDINAEIVAQNKARSSYGTSAVGGTATDQQKQRTLGG